MPLLLRFYRELLLLAAALLLLLPAARATHIVGGELDLQYQRSNIYRVSLTLYFDAINGNSGALDPSATIGIFERGSNRRLRNLDLPLTQNTFVPYTNIACTIGSLSTRRLVYSTELELPANTYNAPGGYYIAMERCCRNGVIGNIQNAPDAGQTFYLEFPAVVQGGQPFRNSSPRIFPPLSDYACLGELFYFDFGGQDADGDSLVYDMVTPLNGHASTFDPRPAAPFPAPYAPIRWSTGLSQTNQMPGNPTLGIHPRSGRLTVRPTRLGLYVFGVRCAEYRRGVKIGEVRRDFQLLVIACSPNQTPQMTVRGPGPGGQPPYRPGRDTLRLLPGPNRCLSLRFTDPDPTSRLSVELRAVNFPQTQVPVPSITQGMVRGPGMPDTLTATLCFPACFNTRGRVYQLDVIVADNGCSLPRRDTVRVAFTAQAPPNQVPSVAMVAPPTQFPISARVGDLVEVELLGLDADQDVVSLELTGRGFTPASVGAQLLAVTSGPGRATARLSWRVDCRAVARGLHEFEIVAAANPCQERQTSTVLVIPVRVQYANVAPVLTSSFPPASSAPGAPPVVIRLPLGGVYEATLNGTDADQDQLTMTAAAGINLAAAGMTFRPSTGPGRAAATFRWEANCEAARAEPLDVTFTLSDQTCQPQPQQRVVRFEVERPPVPDFLPPNVFTPDGNGLNDHFELASMLPPDFCDQRFAGVKVFSRWGNRVYESKERSFRWNGRGVAAGVYYYQVEFTDGRRFKGTVTVLPK
ncbi:gliding motility-associated C-terminal domain-containing protein [Hymenobacter gummosus]|uniref:Gliding motility-associated C-terminal domain-containing protein n=1 Tax=Hymenobacter gummosus TaxID=1776032 RepID=A0A3S0HBX2_9BACT|nr:gliding motility-associated C-terminal domain-containing protein [Hymenobacter gummosus]RTQ52579.1 gliding motility-associated C-terminal domain-containing protein [Hymenobacter gummosus]